MGRVIKNPEMDEQKIQELKLREDITHAFDIYAIDNLVTEVEIQEALRRYRIYVRALGIYM